MHGNIPEPVLAELEAGAHDVKPEPVGRIIPQLCEQARQRDELFHALIWLYTCVLGEDLIAADIQCMVVASTAISNACRGTADRENRIRDAHDEQLDDPPAPMPMILQLALIGLLREAAEAWRSGIYEHEKATEWLAETDKLLALIYGDDQGDTGTDVPDQPKGN